jgi:hypothetical protein
MILPVALYGCQTWSLTLGEEYRLRVLEKRLMKSIFVTKREEMAGGWRRLYASSNIIRVFKPGEWRWTWYVVRMGAMRKPEGKRPLGRLRRRWEENMIILEWILGK